MEAIETPVGQKLIDSFVRFRKLNWRQHLVEGLTRNEMIILMHIKEASDQDPEGVKVSDLSNMLNVASPTVTQQINSLETQGFVERSIDKDDRRAVRIRLTPKGYAAQEKAATAFLDTVSGLVIFLGEDDSNKLADLMVKVAQYFSETRGSNS